MVKSNRIKVGVVGVGHLGKFHVQQLVTIDKIELVGIYDSDKNRSLEVADNFSVKYFKKLDELIENCNAICVVTPTSSHFDISMQALKKGCHVFIEKPITETIYQAKQLLDFSQKNDLIIQVGHIERFNPAYAYLKKQNIEPKFIEIHRLAPFNPRGTDVPVILDLMIHDIDILLSMVNSNIIDIQASGVSVVSSTIDIANARISFENGCVANLTASRISQGAMRKMRIFQAETYYTVDFLKKSVELYHLSQEPPIENTTKTIFPVEGYEKKYIIYEKPIIKEANPLKEELIHFVESIYNGETPEVNGKSATEALSLAIKIEKIIKESIA